MSDLSDFDPTEIALQHIVLALIATLARTEKRPEQWLKEFGALVAQTIDGYHPDELTDRQAALLRKATLDFARQLLGSISLRPPQIPPASGA